jgi:predicted negative regulator of RcsB-dependent stress response
MSWAKRNLYFLISCIVAVVLLGAAGWYCWSSHDAYNANTEKLKAAYDQMKQFADKKPGPGNDQVDNIKTAREETDQAKQRVAELAKFFTPVKGIPNTNKFDNRVLAFAVRETVTQLRKAARRRASSCLR